MHNLHLFKKTSDFTSEYEGDAYFENWVSYTREDGHVAYNKMPVKDLWFRVPYYGSDDSAINIGHWADEEKNLFDNIFDYIRPRRDIQIEEGWTHGIVLEDITIYTSGGVVDDFDKNDPEAYDEKILLKKGSTVDIWSGLGFSRIWPENNILILGNSDDIRISCEYDFDTNKMKRVVEHNEGLPGIL